jgi:hypothetical protein
MLNEFEKKIIRIFRPTQEKGHWRPDEITNFIIFTKT